MGSTCRYPTVEGVAGWTVLAATVAAWDIWALRRGHTTLSAAHAAAAQHRVGQVALVVVDAVIVSHLWHWPRAASRFDPLAIAARRLSPKAVAQ
jgi:hypothetical protein